MKRFVFIAVMLVAQWSKADCSNEGISFFPTRDKIAANSIFVINTYADSQRIISKLGAGFPIYFKSGNEKINLTVVEVLIGNNRMTQAVLKPEKDLAQGKTYTLVIENINPYETPRLYPESGGNAPVTYTILEESDTEKPITNSTFKETGKEYRMLGCGNEVNVIFNCPVKDSSEFLVKATVKNLVTGKTSSYYIEPRDGKIKIGYDMCGGAFGFDMQKEEKHEVVFSIMDASGNTTETTNPVLFTNPIYQKMKQYNR